VGNAMKNSISRHLVEGFYQARMSRDPALIAPLLDDNVKWSISGPVDLIPFCGVREGKEAVIDVIVRVAPTMLIVTKLEFEELLVDRDRAAGFTKLTAVQRSTGRTISYQRAELFRFRDNKITSYHSILDSFDIAEQVLGHPIDLSSHHASANGQLFLA
jgi:ketosteroid isomerase-like protein